MKIVDNFELISKHLTFNSSDDFYFLQVLVRGKDGHNVSGNNKNRLIKYYTIRSIEDLQKYKSEIKSICDLYNARAYIHPTKRSFKDVAKVVLQETVTTYCSENWIGLKSVYSTACGKSWQTEDKRFVVDIDWPALHLDEIKNFIENNCEPIGSKILYEVPTMNGIHLITSPFNVDKFSRQFPKIDVHKNNPTLLYFKKIEGVDKWKHLDETVITENIREIHCDTRDFYCNLVNDDVKIPSEVIAVATNKNYLIKTNEILLFLENLETISGGKRDWRYIKFKGLKDVSGWDCKYIRFYKINEDSWVVCNRDTNPIIYTNLNSETIVNDY